MATDQTMPAQSPVIDSCLDEFDRLYDLGKKPQAAHFFPRFPESQQADFVELIYHEFCRLETDGLTPNPDDYVTSYPQFSQELARLFAIHFGIGDLSINPFVKAEHVSGKVIWPRPGDSIGTFKLVRCLGQGGMGQVFLAQQVDLADRLVVLKISTINNSTESEFLARLKHPNIITVLRHFRTDDNTFHIVVMPYEPGSSLDKLIILTKQSHPPATSPQPARQTKPTLLDVRPALEQIRAELRIDHPLAHDLASPRQNQAPIRADQQIAQWISALSEALATAFRKGVVHGDVKPGNIYISTDNVPYLLDFHLARNWFYQRHRAVMETRDPGGTLLYMPPERLRALADHLENKSIGSQPCPPQHVRNLHRGDLYSLGLVLLEMLTSFAPADVDEISGTSLAQSARTLAEQREHPDWLTDWPGFRKLPTHWRKLLQSLLAADPAFRPSDGFDLANQLKICAAPHTTYSVRYKRLSSSPRSLLAVVSALIAILVCVGLFISSYQFRETELTRSLWQHPDELWNDPSALQEKSPAVKLRASRTDLEHVLREHPQLLSESNWFTSLIGHQNSLDRELWTVGRIEAVTRSLAERAEKNRNKDDADSALDLLKLGLRKWNLPAWRARHQALARLLGQTQSPEVSKNSPNQIITDFISLKDQNISGSAREIRQWENLLRQAPGSFGIRWGYAQILALSGHFANAINQLRSLVQMDENHFESRRLLAFLEYQQREFQSATSDIEIALNLRSDDISSLRLRAILRIYSGQRDELKAEIQRLGDLLVENETRDENLPFDAPINENSKLQSSISQLDESKQIFDISTLESLLKQLPKDNDIKSLLFKLYINHRRLDDAEKIMEQIVQSGDNHVKSLINLAFSYKLNRKNEKYLATGLKIADARDLEDLFKTEKYVRTFCFNLSKSLMKVNHPQANEFTKKMLDVAIKSGLDAGRWHYYMARIKIKENNAELHQVLYYLQEAGKNHLKYISQWYMNDQLFDPHRYELNLKLKDIFPSIPFLTSTTK